MKTSCELRSSSGCCLEGICAWRRTLATPSLAAPDDMAPSTVKAAVESQEAVDIAAEPCAMELAAMQNRLLVTEKACASELEEMVSRLAAEEAHSDSLLQQVLHAEAKVADAARWVSEVEMREADKNIQLQAERDQIFQHAKELEAKYEEVSLRFAECAAEHEALLLRCQKAEARAEQAEALLPRCEQAEARADQAEELLQRYGKVAARAEQAEGLVLMSDKKKQTSGKSTARIDKDGLMRSLQDELRNLRVAMDAPSSIQHPTVREVLPPGSLPPDGQQGELETKLQVMQAMLDEYRNKLEGAEGDSKERATKLCSTGELQIPQVVSDTEDALGLDEDALEHGSPLIKVLSRAELPEPQLTPRCTTKGLSRAELSALRRAQAGAKVRRLSNPSSCAS